MSKALVIGGATLDAIITYEDMETLIHQKENSEQSYLLLEEGKKIEVTEQHYFSGGGATNAGVSLSLMGLDISIFCKLGRDTIGDQVLKEIHSFGIDTAHVKYSNSCGTATSYVVPSLKGDRTIFAYRGANATLLKEELPLAQIAQSDFIYVTSLSKDSAARLPEIVAHAREHNTTVAVNPGASQLKLGTGFLKDALPHISILILNYEEAQILMNSLRASDEHKEVSEHEQILESHVWGESFGLRDFFSEMHQLGVETAVVTNGSKGVYVSTKEQLLFHQSANVEAVNTLGAGDAFGSSFTGALMLGKSPEDAIRFGIINSASVVMYHDAKSGLLNLDTLEERAAQLDSSLLEILE